MNLLKEAFIEGYKQRAEGSDLIFDNASRMYAISLFDKYQAEQLTLTDVVNCNFDESKQLEEEFEINHLINDTYQVVGKDSSTVWKQGTMEECNDWVML